MARLIMPPRAGVVLDGDLPRLNRRRLLAGVLLWPACALMAQEADGAGVVVILHPDNPHAADQRFVQRLYTGVLRGWPDGSPAFTLDLPEEHPLRVAFSQQWLGRSVANMRAVWAQHIFTGRGLPPRVIAGEAEMLRLVATNRNAIGYVSAATADASVKAYKR